MIRKEWLKPKFRIAFNFDVSKGNAFVIGDKAIPWTDPNVFKHLHTHKDFAEIMWIENGRGTHIINGRAKSLRPGDLLFIRPDDVHTFQAAKGETLEFTNINYPREILDYLKKRHFPKKSILNDFKAEFPSRFRLDIAQQRRVREAAISLAAGGRSRIDIEIFLGALLRDLFAFPAKRRTEACPRWFEHAVYQIRRPEHFALGIHEFERLAGRSREHVARETKKWLGLTPSEFLNQVRLDFVAKKSYESDSKINDLAKEAGFPSMSYFYYVFKKRFQVTPLQYRAKKQFRIAHLERTFTYL